MSRQAGPSPAQPTCVQDAAASHSAPTSIEEHPVPAALAAVAVQRHLHGETSPWVQDQVVAEVPVALVFNGVSHAVMMCTPQDLPELALGFALSEGIIDRAGDCYDIELASVDAAPVRGSARSTTGSAAGHGHAHNSALRDAADFPAVEVRLEIASSAFVRLKERRRSLAGRTGCGVCGIDNLQALDLAPEPLVRPAWLEHTTPEVLFKALDAMPGQQRLNRATGAVHAAGFASAAGELVAVYEDVGRHNALDKLLGARALAAGHRSVSGSAGQAWPEQGFIVMSSRASYELVRKCARLGVPLLATISAPTSLAINVAEAAGLQLWGLVRVPRAVRYTR